ncbi:MAG: hypothetical protein HRU21_09485 [Pseudomonadales bacterium]|nr:hypothetical protein [Pseudomonadales bacterium]
MRKRTDQTDGHQYFSLEESVAQPQLSLSYQNRQWCLNADVLRDIQLLYRSRFLIILAAIDGAGKRHRLYLTARQSSSIQLRLLSGCFI